MKRVLLLLLPAVLLLVACGGGAPRATPTGGAPTAGGPGGTPGQGGTVDPCTLVTAAELTTIMGEEMTQQPTEETGTCTFTAAGGIPSINVRFESGDLSVPRTILEQHADVTVAGQPAVIGSLMGVIVYVQHGSQMLVIQSVLTEDTPEVRA
jgi:hypothetical protein